MSQSNTPDAELWTIKDLTQKLQVSRPTIYKMVRRNPAFPPPLRFGRAIRWRRADIEAFLASAA